MNTVKLSLINNRLNEIYLEDLLELDKLYYLDIRGCSIPKENLIVQKLLGKGIEVLVEPEDKYTGYVYIDMFGKKLLPSPWVR